MGVTVINRPLIILALLLLFIPISTSAFVITNSTVDPSDPIQGTRSFSGGQGHTIAVNSTGTRYVTYVTQELGSNIYNLAWSSDGTTWTRTKIGPVSGAASNVLHMAEIAIDSSDTVHLVYSTSTYSIEYRNYTLSGGFGSAIILNTTSYNYNLLPSMAIDSHDVVHIVYESENGVFYTNISPTDGIATPYNLSSRYNSCDHDIRSILQVDSQDTVHIIRQIDTSCGAGPFQIKYMNISSSGWGEESNMTSASATAVYGILKLITDPDKMHILYYTGAGTTYYTNATNLKWTSPSVVIQTGIVQSASMSEDKEGILHFVSQRSGDIRYYNFTSAGLSPMVLLVGGRGPTLLWNTYPDGNIPESGFEMLWSINTVSVNYTIYGPDPIPTPTPSIWTNSEFVTGSITGTIEMGLIVVILSVIATIVIARLK